MCWSAWTTALLNFSSSKGIEVKSHLAFSRDSCEEESEEGDDEDDVDMDAWEEGLEDEEDEHSPQGRRSRHVRGWYNCNTTKSMVAP